VHNGKIRDRLDLQGGGDFQADFRLLVSFVLQDQSRLESNRQPFRRLGLRLMRQELRPHRQKRRQPVRQPLASFY
jgi:hypothetical protein